MAAPEEILRVQEVVIPESVELVEVNSIPGTNGIGEGPIFTANWYAFDADLRDEIDDPILATKFANYEVFVQLGDGTLIAELEETIEFADSESQISTTGFLEPGITPAGGTETFRVISGTGQFANISAVEEVTGRGSVFEVRVLELPEINGTPRSDVIKGTDHPERIRGDRDRDLIWGEQGNDIIEGEAGGDIICGGAGDDVLAASRIDSYVDAGSGSSVLKGNDGSDVIYGSDRSDLIVGGNDEDLLFGKSGNDNIFGGQGFDLLNGSLGNDTLLGGGDIDVVSYLDLTFESLSQEAAGVDVNLAQGKALHSSDHRPLVAQDALVGIENAIGTTRNDRFIGNEESNVFYGIGETDILTEFVSLKGDSYQVAGDVVEYAGNQSEFAFSASELPFAGLAVSGPGTGTDILIGIEFIRFGYELVPTETFAV